MHFIQTDNSIRGRQVSAWLTCSINRTIVRKLKDECETEEKSLEKHENSECHAEFKTLAACKRLCVIHKRWQSESQRNRGRARQEGGRGRREGEAGGRAREGGRGRERGDKRDLGEMIGTSTLIEGLGLKESWSIVCEYVSVCLCVCVRAHAYVSVCVRVCVPVVYVHVRECLRVWERWVMMDRFVPPSPLLCKAAQNIDVSLTAIHSGTAISPAVNHLLLSEPSEECRLRDISQLWAPESGFGHYRRITHGWSVILELDKCLLFPNANASTETPKGITRMQVFDLGKENTVQRLWSPVCRVEESAQAVDADLTTITSQSSCHNHHFTTITSQPLRHNHHVTIVTAQWQCHNGNPFHWGVSFSLKPPTELAFWSWLATGSSAFGALFFKVSQTATRAWEESLEAPKQGNCAF